MLCISGVVCKNRPLHQYIKSNSEKEDLFETPLVLIMSPLIMDLSTIIEGNLISYTYGNKFVLFFKPEASEDLFRNNIISLISSRVVNFLNNYYLNPMTLVSVFQVPEDEVVNILSYHKMNWIAKRNRILGKHYLGIPTSDTFRTHTDVLKLCQKEGFDLQNLSVTLRNGFTYNPYD